MTEYKDQQQSEIIAGEDRKEMVETIDEEVQSESSFSEGQEPVVKQSVNLYYAGFWLRFWAYIVDLIVIGSINRMIVKPLLSALDVSPYSGLSIFNPYSIGYALVFFLYFILMTKFMKQTLGKMIFGLKVVSLKQNSLSWGTIIFREFIGRFISKTVWITYALVGFLPKKQGLHDLFADTTVVLENRR